VLTGDPNPTPVAAISQQEFLHALQNIPFDFATLKPQRKGALWDRSPFQRKQPVAGEQAVR